MQNKITPLNKLVTIARSDLRVNIQINHEHSLRILFLKQVQRVSDRTPKQISSQKVKEGLQGQVEFLDALISQLIKSL